MTSLIKSLDLSSVQIPTISSKSIDAYRTPLKFKSLATVYVKVNDCVNLVELSSISLETNKHPIV